MAAPLVTAEGFACGSLWVPPFRLARGECIQIVAPDYDASLTIGNALANPPAGVRIAGCVHFSQRAWDARGRFARFIRNAPTAAGWVARVAAISLPEATVLLNEFGFDIDPQTRISHLPGNYRALIGLAAGWAHRPDVLVFTAAGVDWAGRQWLAQQVTSRLSHWAAIELSCPYFSQGQYRLDPSILPGAVTITAETRPIGMSA